MNLKKEIEKWVANISNNNAVLLNNIEQEYPAWVIRLNNAFGVAVPYEGGPINEEFANARLFDREFKLGSESVHFLMLTSEIEETRNEFSAFCVDFVYAGHDGSARKALIADPFQWWEKWKTLIGNAIVDKMPHAVLGEMVTYYYLIGKGVNPVWHGPDSSSSDIVDDFGNNEVKSTLKRYDKIITVSGQFQLQADNLNLYFCRFEQNEHGISINDMVEKLVAVRADRGEINQSLRKLGYGIGNSAREKKFILHEFLKYAVDDSFPKITSESFVDGKVPDGIVHIKYDVDLENLNGTSIDVEFLNRR